MAKAKKISNHAALIKTGDINEGTPKATGIFSNTMNGIRANHNEISKEFLKTPIHFRNYPYPGARDLFPFQPELQTVEKYYPHGKEGPIYIDEPIDDRDIEFCKKKAKHLKEKGLLYAYVTPKTDMQSFAMQLSGVEDEHMDNVTQ